MTDSQTSQLFTEIGFTINAIKKELQQQKLLNAKMAEQLGLMRQENELLSYRLADEERKNKRLSQRLASQQPEGLLQ